MADAVTDTHGLIWYLEDSPRLSSDARDVFLAADRGEALVFAYHLPGRDHLSRGEGANPE